MMANDRDAINELRSFSDANAIHFVQHYLYFPQEQVSKSVAALLVKRGFDVENRLGADGFNWLVLAKHQIVPTEELLGKLRIALEVIALENDGEYDGWEAVVD